jgi:hypothetical protein
MPHQATIEVLRTACQRRVEVTAEVRCVEVTSEVRAPLPTPRRDRPLALSPATSPSRAASGLPSSSPPLVMWYANVIRCYSWRRSLMYHGYVYAVHTRHTKFCTFKMI